MTAPAKLAAPPAELIVAKASLTGALFRSDPRSCSREEIEDALALLDKATTQCSPLNVQTCKRWALENLVPSSSRPGSFGKYLVALSNSLSPEHDKRRPSVKRRRLYILYVLSDIFFHAKVGLRHESFVAKLSAHLPVLVRNAASFADSPKHAKKIQDLIDIWEEQGYFDGDFLVKLRRGAEDASQGKQFSEGDDGQLTVSADLVAQQARAAPFIMPAMHGDPATPWYDLPAGNWLSVLEPDSTRPMNPAMIKPLQLNPGPADKVLVGAVQKLLADVDAIYSKELPWEHSTTDMGPMGERIELDDISQLVVGGDTYYGWSYEFCRKMRARRAKVGKAGARIDSRSRSRSRSGSRRSNSGRRHSRSRSSTRSRSPTFDNRSASPQQRQHHHHQAPRPTQQNFAPSGLPLPHGFMQMPWPVPGSAVPQLPLQPNLGTNFSSFSAPPPPPPPHLQNHWPAPPHNFFPQQPGGFGGWAVAAPPPLPPRDGFQHGRRGGGGGASSGTYRGRGGGSGGHFRGGNW